MLYALCYMLYAICYTVLYAMQIILIYNLHMKYAMQSIYNLNLTFTKCCAKYIHVQYVLHLTYAIHVTCYTKYI